MHKFLTDNKGAVLACEDPIGIAQELGHLQIEAQVFYTHWQLSQANGFADKVSNEWVFQSATGVEGLKELIQKNAIAYTTDRIERWNNMLDESEVRDLLMGRTPEEKAKIAQRNAEIRAGAQANQRAEMEAAKKKSEEEFKQYYDKEEADKIIKEQNRIYEELQTHLESLCRDQVAWLQSGALLTVMGRYSDKDDRIGRCGGGAALSVELGQCFAGTENNRAGRAHLAGLELVGDNPLARLINFSNASLAAVHKEIEAAQLEPYDPQAEPTTAVANKVAALLKNFSARVSLMDKALDFIDKGAKSEEYEKWKSVSEKLRSTSWGSSLTGVLGVKLLEKVKGLPASQAEAWLVRRVALTGLSTLGRNAAAQAQNLAQSQQSRVGIAAHKMMGQAYKGSRDAAQAGAGSTRVAALGVMLSLSFVVIKGYQVQTNTTARGATELVGTLLQAVASMASYRAKAYEVTVYNAITTAKIFHAEGMKLALSDINAMQLRALRMTAFKFAAPAALISVYWDVMDAWKSYKRGQDALMGAQIAGALGTVCTVGAALAGILAATTSASAAAFWGATAAMLGVAGAVIAVGAIVLILCLKDEEWRNWLRDNPLNKERKGKSPIHDDLEETLQKLANVKAELQGQGA